jgi:hypothetical protein
MTLREKQSKFASLVATLIRQAEIMGYEVTFGEAWRPPETAALYARDGRGISNSLHTERLAVDINLFRNGRWLTTTEEHRPLGEWWERLSPECRWGGRFGDGNHFSLEHDGRK